MGGDVKEHSGDPSPCDAAFPIVQTDDAEVASVRAVNRCKKDGRDAPECAARRPELGRRDRKDDRPLPSPVRAGDDPMCGPEGLVTRPGDLRYHQVNVVPMPQTASPWGYGPSKADPLTGEVIQAEHQRLERGHRSDRAADGRPDPLDQRRNPDRQVTSGDYVQEWARAAASGRPRVFAAHDLRRDRHTILRQGQPSQRSWRTRTRFAARWTCAR